MLRPIGSYNVKKIYFLIHVNAQCQISSISFKWNAYIVLENVTVSLQVTLNTPYEFESNFLLSAFSQRYCF
jgi:hypothetical protein